MALPYRIKGNAVFFPCISCLVIAIDQWTKFIVARRMVLQQSIRILGDSLRLTYIRNPNAAFGISLSAKIPILPLTILAIALLLFFILHLHRQSLLHRLALSLVFGGAVGNLIDRLRFGEVIDFIDVGLGSYRWPVFNFADSCVTVGVSLLLLGAWRSRHCKAAPTSPDGDRG